MATELLAGLSVLDRHVECVAPEREAARRIADAFDVETRHLLLEAAGAEQHFLLGNVDVIEEQGIPFFAGEKAHWLAECEAFLATLNQHRSNVAGAGTVADVDEKNRR